MRIENNRYDIIFPNEEQDKRYNPYFIFNKNNSLILSKESCIKSCEKNNKDYKYQFKYLDQEDEEMTGKFIQSMFNHYKKMYRESPLKTKEEIDNSQIESFNFFSSNNSSNLISRIWSLIINLTDKFSVVLYYFKKSFCFLESDTIEIFEQLYTKLNNNYLNDLINNMKLISFFCDSESILWKYRNLLNNFNKDEEIKINKYFDYFNQQKINADEEIEFIKKEMDNIDKLNIYWEDKKRDNYKGKLLTLQNILLAYKTKGIEDEEISKLRNEAYALLVKLDKVKNNNNSSMKALISLKNEITNFQTSDRPTKEEFKKLENSVNVFLDLIEKKGDNKLDNIYFPGKMIVIKNIDTYTNQDYASHRASFINKNKIGQNIVGFYYK